MKKILVLTMVTLLLLSLTACGILGTSHIHDQDDETEDSPIDLESFSSLEDFASAIHQSTTRVANADDDIANLSSLDVYYVPTGIPHGYELGKILAGISDIAFYYYPTEALESRDQMMAAEANQSCFEFRFMRWDLNNPLQGIMEQTGKTTADYIDKKYLYDNNTLTYYWVENGDALSMKIPADYLTANSTLSTLCSVETIDR